MVLGFGVLGWGRGARVFAGLVTVGEEGEGGAVGVGVDEFVDVLVGKELQDQGEVVGVQEELSEILEFEYVLRDISI